MYHVQHRYGNHCPQTAAGKGITSVFGMIGTIYFAFCLTLVSERAVRLLSLLAGRCQGKTSGYKMPARSAFRVLAYIVLAYIMLFAVAGGALSSWSIGDSLYFAVITFSTTGLGDFSPSPTDASSRIQVTLFYCKCSQRA